MDKNSTIAVSILILTALSLSAQQENYQERKAKQLQGASPFQPMIDGKVPEQIVFQDDDIIAFKDNFPQLPVHVLIIPKKRIPTMNDVRDEDARVLGKMMLKARDVAKSLGIAESGYRLAINTNQDAGQSVFHIHMHLLGGYKTGAMVEQTWRNKGLKPSATYLREMDSIRSRSKAYFSALVSSDTNAAQQVFMPNITVIASSKNTFNSLDEVRRLWLSERNTLSKGIEIQPTIDTVSLDLNTALVRCSVPLSGNRKEIHALYFERQIDSSWRISLILVI